MDVGFWEICTLLVVALLVVGPERLPEVARTLGSWVRKIRALSRTVSAEIERELEVESLKKELEERNRTIMQQAEALSKELNVPVEALRDLDKPADAPAAGKKDDEA
jgi:sec-independent protein translocase protein TatB